MKPEQRILKALSKPRTESEILLTLKANMGYWSFLNRKLKEMEKHGLIRVKTGKDKRINSYSITNRGVVQRAINNYVK